MTTAMTTLAATRRAARDRQRRHRARERECKAVYPVAINGAVIGMLVKCGWMPDSDAHKPAKVSRALSALLLDAAQKKK